MPVWTKLGVGTMMAAAICCWSFEAAAQPEPLQVSDNGRYLVTESGEPFFWQADTAWALQELDEEQAQTYMTDRVQRGFTVIQGPTLRANQHVNAYGEEAFHGDDTDSPNEAYFAHLDYLIDEAARQDLYIVPVVMWGDEYLDVFQPPSSFDTDKAYRLGQWLGTRYRDRTNVIWVISGEYQSIAHYQREDITAEEKAVFVAMANGLESGHQGAHLMSIHPMQYHSSSRHFHDEPWLDFNMVQTGPMREGSVFSYDIVLPDYERTPIKPTFAAETWYENAPQIYWTCEGSRARADTIRSMAYWGVFSGGFGIAYGHQSIWNMRLEGEPPWRDCDTPTWDVALDAEAGSDMQHIRALLEPRAMLDRVPDPSIILSELGGRDERQVATRDAAGRYAMVYLPRGGEVTVDMTKIAGETAEASWFDPREGTWTEDATYASSGERTFEAPTSGLGEDWVLVLEAPGATGSGGSGAGGGGGTGGSAAEGGYGGGTTDPPAPELQESPEASDCACRTTPRTDGSSRAWLGLLAGLLLPHLRRQRSRRGTADQRPTPA